MNDLSHLPAGRLRIADGTSGLPLPTVNKYRAAWGLEPLAALPPGVKVRASNKVQEAVARKAAAKERVAKSGPGTELKAIFKSNGVPSCQSCTALANQMDGWGPDECESKIDEIVEDMLPRAKEWVKDNRRFIHKLLPDAIESSAIKFKLKGYVKQAIANDRANALVRRQETTWEYGVTTVPERMGDMLPRTLESLSAAGFDKPRLFVDGESDAKLYEHFGLDVTTRYPKIRTFGNWLLSLWELYLRNPNADRYAIFQDDLVTYKNLKSYLNLCDVPDKGYWNLFSFMENEKVIVGKSGWVEAKKLTGRGAVALVFSKAAVKVLLTNSHMVNRVEDPARGHKLIDGGVVEAFNNEGWKEHVHSPSLVHHTGVVSQTSRNKYKPAESFRGEDFDAIDLIEEQKHAGD